MILTGLRPPNYSSNSTNDWQPFNVSPNPVPSSWFVNQPRTLNGRAVPVLSSSQLKAELLPGVGANRYIDNNGQAGFYRDPIDSKYINDISTGNHRASERAGTGIPSMPSSSRPGNFYQSNPHIPQVYLNARGITGDANIHNQVQPSGYTLLEEYVNQIDN